MPEAGDAVTIGSLLTGLVALPIVIYKVYKQFKADAQTDSKGVNVDDRIDKFTSAIQAQLDKAIIRADQLQVQYHDLVTKLASASARAEVLAAENAILREQLQKLREATGIKQ